MTSHRWIRKMWYKARRFVRMIKFLLAGVTIFCVSWIVSVTEWHSGVRWGERRSAPVLGLPTVRTIVAYSEGKLAELDRPSPVSCDRLPVVPTLPYINRTWSPNSSPGSWQHVDGTRVSLYAAYYDERQPQRYIRILASLQGRNLSAEETLYCQTRLLNSYDDNLEVVAARPLEIWYWKWDHETSDARKPLLLSCPLTEPLSGPSIVSVVTEPCHDPTNAFSLMPSHNTGYDRKFTICVKDVNFDDDISQKIIEWIETNRILGVDMIDLYIDNISKESENILLHYRDKGYVRLFHVPIKSNPSISLWQRRRDHMLTYNDCLYRNIEESEYIIPLDIDEVILPKIARTLQELIQRLKDSHNWNPKQNTAIRVRNSFFFDFMQGGNNYVLKNLFENKTKMYVKRDDVRIKKVRLKNVDYEIELVDSIGKLNEVVDSDERRLYEQYKERCGREMGRPKLVSHTVSSALVSPAERYGKALMVTRKVLTVFNHYPLTALGTAHFAGWPAPLAEVQVNHYKEACNTKLMLDCEAYIRRARIDRSALRLRTQLVCALANAPCIGINIT